MPKKLIVFDVSGILLKEKMGGFKDVLVLLGKGENVKKIDAEYRRKKHAGPWGLEKLSKLSKGFPGDKLRKTAFDYCKQNLQERAKETIKELKEKGFLVGALSSNPQFIIAPLTEILALDFSEGTQLEFKEGVATGKIQKKVDRYGKAKILEKKMKDYKLKKKDVIVIGHSITDLPMAELAGTFIAFCPKEDIVKEKATKIVENFHQLKEELL